MVPALDYLLLSTLALSRPLKARGVDSIEHQLQTIGDAARFMRANFTWQRRESLAWQHAAMCMKEAEIARDAEHVVTATIAVEVLLNEDGLFID